MSVFPVVLDTFTTKVDNVTTISAAHINDLQTQLIATETELRITTDRAKFLAYNSVQDIDATGDNTAATIDFDTEIFDTGADFASDTFTAPVTGNYLLGFTVRVSGLTSVHTRMLVTLITSNRSLYLTDLNSYACQSTAGMLTSGTVITDMDAGDTAHVTVTVYGNSKVVDVDGGTGLTSFFGALII